MHLVNNFFVYLCIDMFLCAYKKDIFKYIYIGVHTYVDVCVCIGLHRSMIY